MYRRRLHEAGLLTTQAAKCALDADLGLQAMLQQEEEDGEFEPTLPVEVRGHVAEALKMLASALVAMERERAAEGDELGLRREDQG
jgi:hypothetical protein